MEVKIVKVKGKVGFGTTKIETEDVIKEMYDKGYTLKCAIPSIMKGYGCIVGVDLVFER